MNTARKRLPSFRKNASLSPACSHSPSTGAVLDTRGKGSAKPDWMKSPVIIKAAREAGLTLYEILGMAELMRVAYEKGEIESLHNRLSLLMSQATSLSFALTNIVELSRLDAEPVTTMYRYFDIVALLQEVVQRARLNIGQKPVTVMDVSSAGPVTILSDPGKVRKIMIGLINNAVKFTDRGRIALILNKDQYSLNLIITDTGRGMTAEQMNAAFAPSYTHGHTEKNVHAGSGLGLGMIRNLVKLLEGSITVSSKVGEGTIIEVSFPLNPSEKKNCRLLARGCTEDTQSTYQDEMGMQ